MIQSIIFGNEQNSFGKYLYEQHKLEQFTIMGRGFSLFVFPELASCQEMDYFCKTK